MKTTIKVSLGELLALFFQVRSILVPFASPVNGLLNKPLTLTTKVVLGLPFTLSGFTEFTSLDLP